MEHFDFYGTKYELSVLGKKTFKTWFSFASTIISLALIATATVLLGTDFYFKTNPKIIKSSKIPSKSEPVHINNQNFTIAFRMESDDGHRVEDDKAIAFPYFGYYIYKKKDGVLVTDFKKFYTPVTCDKTEAVDNPLMQNYPLDEFLCFDMRRIKADLQSETDITLYGDWDEDFVSVLWLGYTNCKFDSEMNLSYCLSYEETLERSQNPQYMVLLAPKLTFDAEKYDSPFVPRYDSIFYYMSPFTSFYHHLNYSLVRLNDDKGWMFEDIQSVTMPNVLTEEKVYRYLSQEAFKFKVAEMFNLDIMFTQEQVHYKRVYIKIQELAANLGGIIKLVLLVFGILNKVYATWKIESIFVYKYFSGPKSYLLTKSVLSEKSSAELPKSRKKVKISFKSYFLLMLNCNRKLRIEEEGLDNIRKRLDLEELLRLNAAKERTDCFFKETDLKLEGKDPVMQPETNK